MIELTSGASLGVSTTASVRRISSGTTRLGSTVGTGSGLVVVALAMVAAAGSTAVIGCTDVGTSAAALVHAPADPNARTASGDRASRVNRLMGGWWITPATRVARPADEARATEQLHR